MYGEEKNTASENESKHNESVPNWINGLNVAGFILLLCSFIFTFGQIGTPIPAMISIILASVLFAASAFVKLFNTSDWINYCRANKTETKFFDWLSLIAAVSFVFLFLLSGGFGLFVNKIGVSTGVIDAITTHMAIGAVSFFAVAAIALLYSVGVRLGLMLGYFKFIRADLADKLENIASGTYYMLKLESLSNKEYLEEKFDFYEKQQNVSAYDKKHGIIKDHEFETEDDFEIFFKCVATYYIHYNSQFPIMVRLSESEQEFVKQIAARVVIIQKTEIKKILEQNSNKYNMLSCAVPNVVHTAITMIDSDIKISQASVPASGDLYNQFSTQVEANQFFAAIAAYYINQNQFPMQVVLHDDEKDYIKNQIVRRVQEQRRLSASVSVSSTSVSSLSFGFADTTAIDGSRVTASLMSATASRPSTYALSSWSEGDVASEESGDDSEEEGENDSKRQLIRHRQPTRH